MADVSKRSLKCMHGESVKCSVSGCDVGDDELDRKVLSDGKSRWEVEAGDASSSICAGSSRREAMGSRRDSSLDITPVS